MNVTDGQRITPIMSEGPGITKTKDGNLVIDVTKALPSPEAV